MCVRNGRTRLSELDRGEPEPAVLGFFAATVLVRMALRFWHRALQRIDLPGQVPPSLRQVLVCGLEFRVGRNGGERLALRRPLAAFLCPLAHSPHPMR
jgi:hypothetical protein